MKDIRVVFFGTPAFAVPSLSILTKEKYNLLCVTQPWRSAGRFGKKQNSAVRVQAKSLGIACETPTTLRDRVFLDRLQRFQPRVAVLVAYGLIIPPELLQLPPDGFINVHPSLLPRHRGPSPIPATILAGDQKTGVTIMKLDEGVDTGPLLAQTTIPLTGQETTGSLSEILAQMGAELLRITLRQYLQHAIVPIAQNHAKSTLTKKIRKEDGLIDWNEGATIIERKIRAFYPWPSAWTILKDERIIIHRARIVELAHPSIPGTLIELGPANLGIVCGNGKILEPLELKREGKKTMISAAFFHGYRKKVGLVLGH